LEEHIMAQHATQLPSAAAVDRRPMMFGDTYAEAKKAYIEWCYSRSRREGSPRIKPSEALHVPMKSHGDRIANLWDSINRGTDGAICPITRRAIFQDCQDRAWR
jgi:hypothetical protein